MLFNSHFFLVLYLPATLAGFFTLGAFDRRLGAAWLTLASLFFYGWWDARYLALLVASIIVNYGVGIRLARSAVQFGPGRRRGLLVVGIAANLLALAYFKYTHFVAQNLNALADTDWVVATIVLPLGISFYTFTQIAFLVDAHRGAAAEYNFVHYSLFVTFFPHLIAGPILHHREMMPQFAAPATYRWNDTNAALGLTIFVIGLFKKTVLADGIAPYVKPVFDAAEAGAQLSLLECWVGALGYTMQLYFDFSGYSDMAIGLALLFNIRLPLNFHSPYRAANIIDFWRRWHMTLSRFLRDYLYLPLGGNRRGPLRRYANLLLTMLLGGLWHGASWNFVVWGGLHGFYLVVNHAWRALRRRRGHDPDRGSRSGRLAAWGLTFLAVVVGWVIFRAESLSAAGNILLGMAGGSGVALPTHFQERLGALAPLLAGLGIEFRPLSAGESVSSASVHYLLVLLSISWFAPNTQEITARFGPASTKYAGAERKLPEFMRWAPTRAWALFVAAAGLLAVVSIDRVSTFLYYQF